MTEEKQELQNEETTQEQEGQQEEIVEESATEVVEQSEEVDERELEIQQLKEQLDEAEDRRLRLIAELENQKRRANLDQESLVKYRAQNVLTNVLPVLDNFERALAVETKTEEGQSILTGMDMIYRNLVEALEAEGLQEIVAEEQEFDPNFHQAVMTGNEEDKPSGAVLAVLQKGYLLKDRVLRPTMVKVNE